jgi:hypothetical protein
LSRLRCDRRLIICYITYKCNDCEFATLLQRAAEDVYYWPSNQFFV